MIAGSKPSVRNSFPPRFQLVQLLCFIAVLSGVQAESFDTLIRGGRIVDGTGNPARFADLGLRQGRIVAVGRQLGEATEVIDATGKVVAPGFIDVHTHADDVADLPLAENFIRMGVTTIIAGNCGMSAANIAEFFQRLDSTPTAVNVATLIGQGTVRGQVMGGSFSRPPTATELERMQEQVRKGMEGGAVGLSTGLIYLPGTFSTTDELISLTREIAPFDGTYASHMRSEGRDILEAIAEAVRIGREAGVRVEISHIKLSGNAAWGRTQEILTAIETARAGGVDVTQDQYVYTASSTSLSQLVPESFREGGQFKANLADPERKAAMIAEMRSRLAANLRSNYAYAVIASHTADPGLNGLNVVEAAGKRRGSDTLEHQIETILEIHAAGGASAVFHGISEEDLRIFARHPNTLFASDSGVRRFGEGVPHPRGYGNAARVLSHYVRDHGVLRLEDAVRRLTSLPATTFRLTDRGQIRPGAWADLVIFDPATIRDQATFREPHQYATGFHRVLVNGVTVVKEDAITGARPGHPLRHRRNPGPQVAPPAPR
jgi:N-acyl-D-amino-acid deacylase